MKRSVAQHGMRAGCESVARLNERSAWQISEWPDVFHMSKLYLLILSLGAVLPCLAFAAETGEAAPEVKTGVEGVVTISPAHGGPIRKGEANAMTLPAVAFAVMKETEQVATFITDGNGRFRLELPPGSYQAAPLSRPRIGHYGPFPFEVIDGKVTRVEWLCDSGMR